MAGSGPARGAVVAGAAWASTVPGCWPAFHDHHVVGGRRLPGCRASCRTVLLVDPVGHHLGATSRPGSVVAGRRRPGRPGTGGPCRPGRPGGSGSRGGSVHAQRTSPGPRARTRCGPHTAGTTPSPRGPTAGRCRGRQAHHLWPDSEDRTRRPSTPVLGHRRVAAADRNLSPTDISPTFDPLNTFPQVRGLKRTGWPVGRVLSRRPSRGAGGDHPSTTTVAGRLQRSTRALGRAALERARTGCPCEPPAS